MQSSSSFSLGTLEVDYLLVDYYKCKYIMNKIDLQNVDNYKDKLTFFNVTRNTVT